MDAKRHSGEPGRRVALTGGSGDFGALVLERLVAHPGVASVVAVGMHPPKMTHQKLETAEADVRDAGLAEIFEGADTVIHLAFLIRRYRPRARYEAINVGGSKNVFRAAARAGASQIVYASSAAAYGLVRSHPVPIVEDTPRVHQPDFSYNDAKFRVEAFLDDFERRHPDLVVTRLRMVAALGPGQTRSNIALALARGIVPSTSDVPWSIVWEEDVVDALLLAFEKRAHGAFNLATDQPMSAAELAAATGMRSLRFPRWLGVAGAHVSGWLAALGVGTAVDPAWFRYSDAVLVLSSDKALRELGWKRRCNTALEVIQQVRKTMTR